MDFNKKVQEKKDEFKQRLNLPGKKVAAMAGIRIAFRSIVLVALVIGIGYGLVNFWSYIFARNVTGVIEKVERVQVNVALMQTTSANGKDSGLSDDLFSFAVAIRQPDGENVTASADDRQWAVAQKGQCATAKFYPYPPWALSKSGTYFGARLLKLATCPEGSVPPPAVEEKKDSSSEAPAAAAAAVTPETSVPAQAVVPPVDSGAGPAPKAVKKAKKKTK